MDIKGFCRWSRLISFFRMNVYDLLRTKYYRDNTKKHVADMARELKRPGIFVWISMFWTCLLVNASPHDYYYLEFYKMPFRKVRKHWTRGRFLYMVPHLGSSEVRKIMREKNVFNRVFADFIGRDWMQVSEDTPAEDTRAFLEKHGEAIFKPATGNGGSDIRLLKNVDNPDIVRILKESRFYKSFLLEERVKNHETLARFSTQSLNTLRVISVLEPEGARILCAYLKFNAAGGIADNYSEESYACPVNPETGVIDLGMTNKRDLDGDFADTHPYGFKVVGIRMPYWDELKEMVAQAMKRLDGLYFCPWDVAITPNGPILIEGNTDCGTYFQKLVRTPVGKEMNRVLRFAKADMKRKKRTEAREG